ncbi:MAG: GntG family PLP-dependent aldolase [Acidobacteriota bacterium]|nr:GntG family PLP-dependent aldolase [Acidobacteriota bacterium]
MSTLPIDLRSDTVTLPSDAMRRAMASAEVGDDVYGEDPTINRLEARAAEIFAREAALFVPSGTMGNQIAIKLHTRPGQEVICEARGHVYNYEMAMMAWFSGCQVRTIDAPLGILSWPAIAPKLALSTYYMAQTGLISMENTHNMAGGTVTPVANMREIIEQAHARKLPVHLDGARVFNAATFLDVSVAELTQGFDSVMFCLSKGLGAPVGSMLVGGRDFIAAARATRKALGGGMRQAGILAAAGLIALEEGPKRLHEDHANARLLAEGLAQIPSVAIDPATVETNIVIFDVSATGKSSAAVAGELKSRGVLCGTVDAAKVRLVTHLNVSAAQCKEALAILREVCQPVGFN